MRGLAESQLEQQPFVVPYPRNRARNDRETAHANASYELDIAQEETNPYAPFASQLDWEVAKWVKLRGLGCTVFDEFMAIPGVCTSLALSLVEWPSNAFQIQERLQLSFKSTQELNRIIDNMLPGRPPFMRHEVLIDDKICEVYYRDIIGCIRTLFGDPDFASALVFQPEKHYVDEKKEKRMYHDIQTGRWWWHTQVSNLCKHGPINKYGSIFPHAD